MSVIPISNPSAAECFVSISIFRQFKLELQTQFPASLTIFFYIYLKTDISQIQFFSEMMNFHKLFYYYFEVILFCFELASNHLCTGLVVQGLKFQRQYRIITRV